MTELEKDVIQWDVKNWSIALNYWEEKIDWNAINTCLELGAREGGLSLWLALKGKNVVCSNYENTRTLAEPLHQKYDFREQSNINYQDIDATKIPYENHFDLIVFKSMIGGIGRNGSSELQQLVFDQIYKALKPGGKLIFAENLPASYLHRFFRKHFTKWSGYWRYPTRNETIGYLTKFKNVELKSTGFLGAFGRSENSKHLFAKLDHAFINKITPANWKYILYGIAEK